MNAKAELCMHLLAGRVINLTNCFGEIGISNPGREIPRMVEIPFGVVISKTPRTGKNRFGSTVNFKDYRLNFTPHNKKGVEKMRQYIADIKKAHYERSLK